MAQSELIQLSFTKSQAENIIAFNESLIKDKFNEIEDLRAQNNLIRQKLLSPSATIIHNGKTVLIAKNNDFKKLSLSNKIHYVLEKSPQGVLTGTEIAAEIEKLQGETIKDIRKNVASVISTNAHRFVRVDDNKPYKYKIKTP